MTDDQAFISTGAVILTIVLSGIPACRRFARGVAAFAVGLAYVLTMLSIVLGFTCCRTFYERFGWTPVSVVLGTDHYKRVASPSGNGRQPVRANFAPKG